MLVVLFVVLGELGLRVLSEDVLCDLLEVGLEVVDKVFEDVQFICLEVHFEEHVVRDDDGKRHPIQRTFFDAWLEEVWMVAYFLEAHEDVHHACRLVVLLLPVLVPNDLVVEVLLPPTHAAPDDGL